MQTFLPYADFHESAAVLHMKHLGKQRVENLQIMKALVDPAYGWQNHPAVRMWRGHESALMEYQTSICYEWHNMRGYKDTCLDKTLAVWSEVNWYDEGDPAWLGDEAFHAAMRSNLLRKKPEHYSQFGWTEPDDYAYVWPV
jgi:hypothetical protein